MKKFYNLLKKLKFPNTDKLKHRYIGDWIREITWLLITLFIVLFNFSEWWYMTLFIPALIVGLTKEKIDKETNLGTAEIIDAFHTCQSAIFDTIKIIILILILT